MRFWAILATSLTAFFGAVTVAGCGSDPRGTVTELSYTPAHQGNVQVDDYILMCFPAGSSVICNSVYTGSHLETREFEAQWNATLRHCDTESRCDSDLVGITKEQYDTWSVGDYYPTILTESGIRKVGR